jgi:hypothetical protein
MGDKPYSSSVWDEDLNVPSPPAGVAAPVRPSQAPAVPYSPGVFDRDLQTPVVALPPVVPPDTRPWYVRAGQTADDAARAFANTITFGGADRFAGYMGGQGTDAEVAKSAAARARSPYASTAGDIAGGVALPGFGAEALAARIGARVASPLAGRIAGYGAVGAGVGGLQGAGNTYTGNVPDYVNNALMGGVLGGVTGGTLGGAFGPRPLVSAAKTPTTAEQYTARDLGYNALRENKGVYEEPHLPTLADRLERDLSVQGFTSGDSKTTWRALDRMREEGTAPGGGHTPADLESIRQSINKIPRDPGRSADRESGRYVKNAIDDFYTNPPLGAVRPGLETEAETAARIADISRQLHGGARRSQTYDNILKDADIASRNPAGGPRYEDAVWSGVKNLEKSDRPGAMPKLAGYNDDEQEALKKITYPSWLQSGLRGGSKLLGADMHGIVNPFSLAATGAGGGGFLASYFGADPTTGAAMGAAAPLAGLLMRGASGKMARNAIDNAYNVIHQSNPLYDYRVLTAGTKSGGGFPASVNDAARNAVTAAIVNRGGPTMLPPFTVEEGQ